MTIRASADASLSVKFLSQCRFSQEIGKGDRRASTLGAEQPRDNQNNSAPKVPWSLNDPVQHLGFLVTKAQCEVGPWPVRWAWFQSSATRWAVRFLRFTKIN